MSATCKYCRLVRDPLPPVLPRVVGARAGHKYSDNLKLSVLVLSMKPLSGQTHLLVILKIPLLDKLLAGGEAILE
jgi:hypothetical protein